MDFTDKKLIYLADAAEAQQDLATVVLDLVDANMAMSEEIEWLRKGIDSAFFLLSQSKTVMFGSADMLARHFRTIDVCLRVFGQYKDKVAEAEKAAH